MSAAEPGVPRLIALLIGAAALGAVIVIAIRSRSAPAAERCAERGPTGRSLGLLCTLPPGHGGPVHESWFQGRRLDYWPRTVESGGPR